jgi:enoyl-CoA hydratase
MNTYENLRLEMTDHIATITLDRPPANALSMALYRDIRDAFTDVSETDPADVRVVVFTGAGKFFCAGRDVKSADNDPPEKRNEVNHAAHAAVYNCAVPVIAAVNGAALGGGMTFVLETDIVLASTEASFGLPEINFGLAGGMAATRRALNQFQGRKLYFTGRRVSAEQMERWHLVDTVTTPERLLPEALELAAEIASKSPLAMRAAKWSANEIERVVHYEQANRAIQSRATLGLASSEDHKEAVRAFAERRKPVFKGR